MKTVSRARWQQLSACGIAVFYIQFQRKQLRVINISLTHGTTYHNSLNDYAYFLEVIILKMALYTHKLEVFQLKKQTYSHIKIKKKYISVLINQGNINKKH